MLSGETASGRYPVEAIGMMDRIAIQAEQYLLNNLVTIAKPMNAQNRLLDVIGRAAFRIVEDLDLRLLIASSSTGETALFLSKSRTRAMILGATNSELAMRRMCLFWGVVPALCVKEPGISEKEEFLEAASKEAIKLGVLAVANEQVAMITGTPICVPTTVSNAVEVAHISS